MFNSLKKIFQQSEEISQKHNNELNILCGLMIEAANMDGKIDMKEVNKISKV